MKFTPLKFMATLSAGGIALMAFNYLQFAYPPEEGFLKLYDISWQSLAQAEAYLSLFLIVIMFSFTVFSIIFSTLLLWNILKWYIKKQEYEKLINNPMQNVFIFAPIASLSMTVNVIWGPLLFFIPEISVQKLMVPSFIFFIILWSVVLFLQVRVGKVWLRDRLDISKLTFVWLLDVFAISLVSLTGTGIASISTNELIASISAIASFFLLFIGITLFTLKLPLLIYVQIKNVKLPDKGILPAFFLVIPITCLLGVSLYKILAYLQMYFSYDVKVLSFFIVVFSYVIAISWGVFALYLLRQYFKNDFLKSSFSPPQWGFV